MYCVSCINCSILSPSILHMALNWYSHVWKVCLLDHVWWSTLCSAGCIGGSQENMIWIKDHLWAHGNAMKTMSFNFPPLGITHNPHNDYLWISNMSFATLPRETRMMDIHIEKACFMWKSKALTRMESSNSAKWYICLFIRLVFRFAM